MSRYSMAIEEFLAQHPYEPCFMLPSSYPGGLPLLLTADDLDAYEDMMNGPTYMDAAVALI